MKHKYAKWLALLCTLALALSMVPAALAAEEPPKPSEPTLSIGENAVQETGADNKPVKDSYKLELGTTAYDTPASKTFTVKLENVTETNAQKVRVTAPAGFAVYSGETDINGKITNVPNDGLTVTVKSDKGLEPSELKEKKPVPYTGKITVAQVNAEKNLSATVTASVIVTKKGMPGDLAYVGNLKLAEYAKGKDSLLITAENAAVGGVVLATGAAEPAQAKRDLFNKEGFSFKYACTTEASAPTKAEEWKSSTEELKAAKEGSYKVYYKVVGNKHYEDGNPVQVGTAVVKVTENKVTVTFSDGSKTLATVKTGLDLKIPADFTAPAYNAEGNRKVEYWTTDAANKEKADLTKAFEKNTTVYAKFGDEFEVGTLTVQFYEGDEATSKMTEGSAKIEKADNTLVQLNVPKDLSNLEKKDKDGKVTAKCIGWKTAAGDKVAAGVTKISANMQLYPVWQNVGEEVKPATEKEVKVSYVVDDKATEGTATVKVADNTLVKLNVANPTKAGYTFAGWTTDAEGKNAVAVGKTAVTEGMKLYAQFTKNSTPDTSTPSVNVPTQTPVVPSTKPSGSYTAEGWTATTGGFTHKEPDGTLSKGSRWIEVNGVGHRYVFDNNGILVTKAGQAAAGITNVTADGDILMNGNLYYLNPARNESDPRTCYVMTNYLRTRANYGDQTYYDQDGITFEGWMKNAEGGLRYQTRLDGTSIDRYLIVWRAQILPQCQHPDYPGDASHMLAAGKYFFDDDGVLVTKEGWNDGKDGKEYYTNAQGVVTQERAK